MLKTVIFYPVTAFVTGLGFQSHIKNFGTSAGDALSISMDMGYLICTGIFAAIFVVVIIIQIKARKFHSFIYWNTIVATTTVGTTLADFADRSLGIGCTGGSAL